MLHVPNYAHGLVQRKQDFGVMGNFVHCMSRNSVDVRGQVGSDWMHTSELGVEGPRQNCADLSDKYETRFHLAGYAMLEALSAMTIEQITLNGPYQWPDWRQGMKAKLGRPVIGHDTA